MTLEGYDISHHQATTPDLTGIDFVICRATYGTNPDDMYRTHAANVRAQGKVVGAYHFARPASVAGQSVEEQVAAFLDAAPDADFWVVDREKDGDNGTITLTATRQFISLVHATGRRIGLYSSESAFRDCGQDFAWVARWGGPFPTIPWDIWQWDGGGTDKLDNDTFRGTRGALLALGAPLEAFVDTQIAVLTAAIEEKNEQITRLGEALDAQAKELTDAQAKISSASLLLQNGTEYRAHAILVGETA